MRLNLHSGQSTHSDHLPCVCCLLIALLGHLVAAGRATNVPATFRDTWSDPPARCAAQRAPADLSRRIQCRGSVVYRAECPGGVGSCSTPSHSTRKAQFPSFPPPASSPSFSLCTVCHKCNLHPLLHTLPTTHNVAIPERLSHLRGSRRMAAVHALLHAV